MPLILTFVISVFAVAVLTLVIFARLESKKHKTSAKEEFVGICKSAVETASQKEGRKQKTLALLRERGELSNADIRKALGVSSRTAVRYLDELEREGKVGQVGAIGHAVTYRPK